MIPEKAALLVIDVQKGFHDPSWGQRNNPQAEAKIAELLAAWRKREWPVFHVQHVSTNEASTLRPGQEGFEIQEVVTPLTWEPVIRKQVNSAFIGTDLEARLRQKGVEALVVTGLTTNHCVSTTVRMAANLGFAVYVVEDATAAFERVGHDGRYYAAEEIHAVSLTNLHGEFATVVSAREVLEGS